MGSAEIPATPFFRGTSRGQAYNYMGAAVTVLASGADTNGELSVLEAIVPAGAEPPRHVHDREDEAYYVLDGRIAFEAGDAEYDARSGDLVFLPQHVPHVWTVVDSPAHVVWIARPGGIDELFTELGVPIDAFLLPDGPPEDKAARIARMIDLLESKFGIHPQPRA